MIPPKYLLMVRPILIRNRQKTVFQLTVCEIRRGTGGCKSPIVTAHEVVGCSIQVRETSRTRFTLDYIFARWRRERVVRRIRVPSSNNDPYLTGVQELAAAPPHYSFNSGEMGSRVSNASSGTRIAAAHSK